jgi:hypothetical protein
VHERLGVATLYSGKRGCHADTYWGCPAASAASWIDGELARRALQLDVLVTHIPPPNVLGLTVHGKVGEAVCCWDEFEFDDGVLPATRPSFHAFGHGTPARVKPATS